MATPRKYVEAPPVTPLPFGLLSAAMVVDDQEPHWQMGLEYETGFCGASYDSEGACVAAPDYGTGSVSVADTSIATLTLAGFPAGTYTINWGEGALVEDATPNGATHDYTAPGDYAVVITGPNGYVATGTVTVADGVASGPFALLVGKQKIETDGQGLVLGDPFVVYHLLSCRMPGGGVQMGAERARRALMGGEGRAVERVTGEYLAAHPDAVDITPTPGTALAIVDALALLEKWSAANYGGTAVIHAPRDVALVGYSERAIERQGTRLETGLGTRVAAGAGYDNLVGPGESPEVAGTDEAWLYVTGQVVVRRSNAIEVGPVMGVTPRNNSFLALAERPYVVTTECIVGAVLVSTLAPAGA